MGPALFTSQLGALRARQQTSGPTLLGESSLPLPRPCQSPEGSHSYLVHLNCSKFEGWEVQV